MKREKYRYDEWPEDGIAGIDNKLAVELAIGEQINAYVYLKGRVKVTWLGNDGKRCSGIGMDGDVLLNHWDVESAYFGATACIEAFRARRINIEADDERQNPRYRDPRVQYLIDSPYMDITRDDLVFYTDEIESYVAEHSKPPRPSDELLLSALKKHGNKDITTESSLNQAISLRDLFLEEQSRPENTGKAKDEIYLLVGKRFQAQPGSGGKLLTKSRIRKQIGALTMAERLLLKV